MSTIYSYSTNSRLRLAKSAVCLFYQSVRFTKVIRQIQLISKLLDKARDFNLVQHCLRNAVLAITNVTIHLMNLVEPTLRNKLGCFEDIV